MSADTGNITGAPGPEAATLGRVVAVNISSKKTVRKPRGEKGTLLFDRGFENDAHAGDWHRQVSLLAIESIDRMREKGLDVGPGDFAENITTEGLDLCMMPIGTKLRIGDALLELSQIGKLCHTKCAIFYQAGDCVMPREGVFAVVREPGDVAVGDVVAVIEFGDGTCDRPHADTNMPPTPAAPDAPAAADAPGVDSADNPADAPDDSQESA